MNYFLRKSCKIHVFRRRLQHSRDGQEVSNTSSANHHDMDWLSNIHRQVCKLNQSWIVFPNIELQVCIRTSHFFFLLKWVSFFFFLSELYLLVMLLWSILGLEPICWWCSYGQSSSLDVFFPGDFRANLRFPPILRRYIPSYHLYMVVIFSAQASFAYIFPCNTW